MFCIKFACRLLAQRRIWINCCVAARQLNCFTIVGRNIKLKWAAFVDLSQHDADFILPQRLIKNALSHERARMHFPHFLCARWFASLGVTAPINYDAKSAHLVIYWERKVQLQRQRTGGWKYERDHRHLSVISSFDSTRCIFLFQKHIKK